MWHPRHLSNKKPFFSILSNNNTTFLLGAIPATISTDYYGRHTGQERQICFEHLLLWMPALPASLPDFNASCFERLTALEASCFACLPWMTALFDAMPTMSAKLAWVAARHERLAADGQG